MSSLIGQFLDMQVLTMMFAAVAAGATVLTLAMPLFVSDTLAKRMKAVALEREKIRQRERERLAQSSKVALRQSPKMYMKRAVDNFNLSKWVGQEEARADAGASRLSRPGALRHLSVLPHDHAGGHAAGVAVLYFRRAQSRLSADGQDRDLHRLRLFRHAQPKSFP